MRIVAGVWGGRRIASPPGRQTRPTTDRLREAWMSAIADRLLGARVLDLFAGSGALGLEALSRGARQVTFVENATPALRTLQENIEDLAPSPAAFDIVRADALRFAAGLNRHAYDLAFADPPYARGFATRIADLFSRVPFARLLCLEHDAGEPVAGAIVRQKRYGDSLLTFLRADDD